MKPLKPTNKLRKRCFWFQATWPSKQEFKRRSAAGRMRNGFKQRAQMSLALCSRGFQESKIVIRNLFADDANQMIAVDVAGRPTQPA
jgi:hypothetical protein